MTRISIGGFVAAVFLIPVIAFAQVGQGTLTGKVLDRDGKPLQGAVVRIQNLGNKEVDEIKTNKSGSYSFVGLYQGRFKAVVIVDGHALMARGDTTGDDIFVTGGQETTINFDLRKAPAAPIPASAAPPPPNSKGKTDAEKKADAEMRGAFAAGLAALKANNYDEAIKQLKLAAEKDQSQPAIFGNLGLAYLRTKKYDDAIEVLRKSLELKPDDAGVHLSLSQALAVTGKIDEAMQEAEECAKLDPAQAAQGYYTLGAALTDRGKAKEGVELFKKSIEIDPKYGPSYYQLGVAYFSSADTIPQAVPALEKYLQLEPNGQYAQSAKQLIDAAKASSPGK